MIHPNFTVEWPGGFMEYPYWSRETHDEQKARALENYERRRKAGIRVTLTRLSTVDLEYGDYSPTLLRDSKRPDYDYAGFPEAWEQR